MRPLLPHAPHVAKPSLTWLHRQATQQKQQLHTRSYRHSCFKRQIQITGLLQFDMNITSAFQQHLNSLLQPLQYLPLSMPTPASTTHSRQSGSDVKATALWHGVDVQQSAKLKCNLPEASTAALQALSVHSMDKLQVSWTHVAAAERTTACGVCASCGSGHRGKLRALFDLAGCAELPFASGNSIQGA